MNRARLMLTIAFLWVTPLWAQDKPNVVLMVTDNLGWVQRWQYRDCQPGNGMPATGLPDR